MLDELLSKYFPSHGDTLGDHSKQFMEKQIEALSGVGSIFTRAIETDAVEEINETSLSVTFNVPNLLNELERSQV